MEIIKKEKEMKKDNSQVQCRVAPSLGEFERPQNEVWGTTDYVSQDEPTIFMGLYGLKDFYALWTHKGPKYIFWCGSDIRHFVNGYWLDEEGKIKMNPYAFASWIKHNCESWVENQVEYDALAKLGIISKIGPSFLGNIDEYEISYKQSEKPKVYSSVSGDDFLLYGWQSINMLAARNKDIEFHLYGNTKPWNAQTDNVIIHGRVPKEQMNEEIKHMQGALRMVEFDGFSEILAKSILWGQYPISMIKYPHMLSIDELSTLKDKKEPNVEGAVYYRTHLNKYPWNEND